MTVQELIDKLREFSPTLEVLLYDTEYDICDPIRKLELVRSEQDVIVLSSLET